MRMSTVGTAPATASSAASSTAARVDPRLRRSMIRAAEKST